MAGFSFADRGRSFRHALSGLGFMLRTQHNAWLHAVVTVLVVAAGLVLGLNLADWKWLLLTIALVWAAEAMNTAFEHLCDVVSPEHDESVQRAKDIAAGAVLICAVGAVAMGAVIFGPYLVTP